MLLEVVAGECQVEEQTEEWVGTMKEEGEEVGWEVELEPKVEGVEHWVWSSMVDEEDHLRIHL